MKRLTILTVTILLISLALCVASSVVQRALLADAHAMVTDVFTYMQQDDSESARETLVALAARWKRWSPLFEILADHEDLHNVKTHLIESQLTLDYPDPEDFYTALSEVGESLDHLAAQESLTWSNIL